MTPFWVASGMVELQKQQEKHERAETNTGSKLKEASASPRQRKKKVSHHARSQKRCGPCYEGLQCAQRDTCRYVHPNSVCPCGVLGGHMGSLRPPLENPLITSIRGLHVALQGPPGDAVTKALLFVEERLQKVCAIASAQENQLNRYGLIMCFPDLPGLLLYGLDTPLEMPGLHALFKCLQLLVSKDRLGFLSPWLHSDRLERFITRAVHILEQATTTTTTTKCDGPLSTTVATTILRVLQDHPEPPTALTAENVHTMSTCAQKAVQRGVVGVGLMVADVFNFVARRVGDANLRAVVVAALRDLMPLLEATTADITGKQHVQRVKSLASQTAELVGSLATSTSSLSPSSSFPSASTASSPSSPAERGRGGDGAATKPAAPSKRIAQPCWEGPLCSRRHICRFTHPDEACACGIAHFGVCPSLRTCRPCWDYESCAQRPWCKYTHRDEMCVCVRGVVGGHEGAVGGRGGVQGKRCEPCRYGETCRRRPDCWWTHPNERCAHGVKGGHTGASSTSSSAAAAPTTSTAAAEGENGAVMAHGVGQEDMGKPHEDQERHPSLPCSAEVEP